MKRTIAAILAGSFASALHAQTLRVTHDNRAELIGVMFRVAGAPDFGNGAIPAYNRAIDSTFAPFKNHAVFTEINRLRRQYRLSLSAVTTMAPQIVDLLSFAERAPIDAPSSTLAGSWGGADARPFLAAASDFAHVAPVEPFLRDHKPMYDSATARLQRAVDPKMPGWFATFFGATKNEVFIVSPMLVNASGNFASEFVDGATHERYGFIGVPSVDARGVPVVPPDVLPTVVHEFSHSFVNRVVDARNGELRVAGEQIYAAVQPQMRAIAYTSWPTMLSESVVRASVIRYLRTNVSTTATDQEIGLQRGLGFVWIDQLAQLLGEYESQRLKYKTFDSFMPRIVDFYNGLAPRMNRVLADFERQRPTITGTSIVDSAQNVSASLDKIVVHFDQPVDAIITLVGNFGGSTPELTSATFDAAHTTLTLGVKLDPGRDYVLPLGPGALVGRNGYPLKLFVIRFRTASQ